MQSQRQSRGRTRVVSPVLTPVLTLAALLALAAMTAMGPFATPSAADEPLFDTWRGFSTGSVNDAMFPSDGKTADFNWRQLLSYDSCTQCARCQSSCPAFATDKPLSPMKVVLDIASIMGTDKNLKGDTIAADVLWACTSCRACVRARDVRRCSAASSSGVTLG